MKLNETFYIRLSVVMGLITIVWAVLWTINSPLFVWKGIYLLWLGAIFLGSYLFYWGKKNHMPVLFRMIFLVTGSFLAFLFVVNGLIHVIVSTMP